MNDEEIQEQQRSANASQSCCWELADEVKYGQVDLSFGGTAYVKCCCGCRRCVLFDIRFCPFCGLKLPGTE